MFFDPAGTRVHIGGIGNSWVEIGMIHGVNFAFMLGDQAAVDNIKAALAKTQEWARVASENKDIKPFEKIAGTYLTLGGNFHLVNEPQVQSRTPVNIVFKLVAPGNSRVKVVRATDGRDFDSIGHNLASYFYTLDSLGRVAKELRTAIDANNAATHAE
jgi:hypothetical protein